MSLDALQAKITALRNKSAEIIDDYTATQQNVYNDPALTDVGKSDILQPLHTEVSEQVSALRAEEKQAIQATREALEKKLFGLTSNDPTLVISFRDAMDRVERLRDQGEAQDLYTNAVRSNDSVLAQAILSKAITYNWRAVISEHMTRNPSAAGALEDLAGIAQLNGNSFMSTLNYMPPSFKASHPAGFTAPKPLNSRNEPRR